MVHPSASVASSPSELPTQTQKERQVDAGSLRRGQCPWSPTLSRVSSAVRGGEARGVPPRDISQQLRRVDQDCHHPHKKYRHLLTDLLVFQRK